MHRLYNNPIYSKTKKFNLNSDITTTTNNNKPSTDINNSRIYTFEDRIISKANNIKYISIYKEKIKKDLTFSPNTNILSVICNLKNKDYYRKNCITKREHKSKTPNIPIEKPERCYCNEILIVDDEKININSLKLLLKKKCKLDSEFCFDGIEAVDKVRNNFYRKKCCNKIYKLIFMDLMMPKMKGDQASKEIMNIYKENNCLSLLNIIVVSAHDCKEVIDLLKDISSIKKFICKPAKSKVIEEVVFDYYYSNKK